MKFHLLKILGVYELVVLYFFAAFVYFLRLEELGLWFAMMGIHLPSSILLEPFSCNMAKKFGWFVSSIQHLWLLHFLCLAGNIVIFLLVRFAFRLRRKIG